MKTIASSLIVILTQDNFEKEALQSTTPILVDFWAEWCGHCKQISPMLDELAAEYQGKVKVGKVNVDECEGLAAKYQIRSIPALFILKNGIVTEQMTGAQSKRDLKASLDRAFA